MTMMLHCVRYLKSGRLAGGMALALSVLHPPCLLAAEPSPYVFSITTDRPNALYKVGEPVTFTIRLAEKGKPVDKAEIHWKTSNDKMPPVQEGTTFLQNGETKITSSLEKPGFLQCDVNWKSPSGEIKAVAGAGIAPDLLTPSLPVPEDFDSFWYGQKQRLATVAPMTQMKAVSSPVADIDTFDVQIDCVGNPVSGYYAKPANASPKSLPALINFHGAGVGPAWLQVASNWAKEGFIALDINAHGIPNDKDKSYYDDLYKGELKDYFYLGQQSRETSYFLGMILRALRAADFITAQPEWDGRTLIVTGSSQGAAQAIAVAALEPKVTFLAGGVPALCDLTGILRDRASGWPRFFGSDLARKPNEATITAVRYFDSMNMATRIKAPSFIAVGFIDRTCAPSTVYCAYNNLTGTKEIFNDITAAHVVTPEAGKRMRSAILAHKSP